MEEPKTKALKVFETMMEKDYCSQWMGMELLQMEVGYCKLKMTVRKEMLNGFGSMHGGMAYAFADSALAFASNSYGRVSVLINGNMSYSKAAVEGDVLLAEAKILSLGHKKADIDVTIYKEGEEPPYYFFRGTVYRTSKEY